jgi:hypothetical protein
MSWPRPERRAAPLLLALLAGCAQMPAPPATGPVVARFDRPGGVLAARVERLAADCWLGSGAMTVDRRAGVLEISDASGLRLAARIAPAGAGAQEVTLSGPALADPARRARMAEALSRVLEGPAPAC